MAASGAETDQPRTRRRQQVLESLIDNRDGFDFPIRPDDIVRPIYIHTTVPTFRL